MIKQTAAQQRDIRQQRNGQIRETILDIGIVGHFRPTGSLQAIAYKEVNTQTKGSQRQTGNVLISLERYRQRGEQQTAQSTCQEGNRNAHTQRVGITAADIAKDGANSHDTLNTQIQAAGFLHNDFAYGAVEQRDVVDNDIVQKGSNNTKLIHFHYLFLPSSSEQSGTESRNQQPAPGTGSHPGAYWQSWSPPAQRWMQQP